MTCRPDRTSEMTASTRTVVFCDPAIDVVMMSFHQLVNAMSKELLHLSEDVHCNNHKADG